MITEAVELVLTPSKREATSLGYKRELTPQTSQVGGPLHNLGRTNKVLTLACHHIVVVQVQNINYLYRPVKVIVYIGVQFHLQYTTGSTMSIVPYHNLPYRLKMNSG
jgi:hypothetical protein